MADIMLGAKVAEALVEESKEKVNNLRSRGINPTLAIVRVGAREDDLSYERGATKRMEKMDIDIKKYEYPVDISQQEFETEFERIYLLCPCLYFSFLWAKHSYVFEYIFSFLLEE